jgi:hypothetical protein
MQPRFIVISAALGLIASIAFALLSYKIASLPIGVYFAILIVSIALILIIFYVEFHALVSDLRQLTNSIAYRFRSLRQILEHTKQKRVTLYLSSLQLLLDLASAKQFATISLAAVDVYVSPLESDVGELDPTTAQMLNDRFHSVSLTPSEYCYNILLAPIDGDKNIVFLAPPESIDFSDAWISSPSSREFSIVLDALNERIIKRAIPLRSLRSPSWLLGHCRRHQRAKEAERGDLADGQITSSSPDEIYREQIHLSRGAKSILAFDMTEVEEWFDGAGLGRCLAENIKSGAIPGADIRRVFFCKSRAYLATNPAYGKSLVKVIKAHVENGLHAGLIFQEDIKDTRIIRDCVIYDDSVVWVERVPTARHSGEGFFSTKMKLIAEQRDIFERVWAGEFTIPPEKQAQDFILEREDAPC